ncbi:hypothetical protein [Zavarzinia sp.]|uniref:hypothetical protein n=1 Tax=Zavarzinia sp. TaxID=2027920 RepID=UPI0035636B34
MGDLVRCRLNDTQPPRLAEVDTIRIADPLMRSPPDLVNDVDLDDPPAGKLVWITYQDRSATGTILVRCGPTRVAGDHEVTLPGDQMIEAQVWSAGKTWTVRLWEGGKVKIDPCVTDSEGKTRILDAKFGPDGTIALDQPVDTLPDTLLEDCAWALDFAMGGPRLRREAPGCPVAPSAVAAAPAPAGEAAAVLGDLLGRLGLGARAVRLKDAPADKIRDEIVAWVAGLNETRLLNEIDAERGQLAAALGLTFDSTGPALPAFLAAIAGLKDPTPAPDSARSALLDVLSRLGGDADTMGINGASEAEIHKAIFAMAMHLEERARVEELDGVLLRAGMAPQTRQWTPTLIPQLRREVDAFRRLLPEVEVACPHCQGGMLITPELLRAPEVAG